MRPSFLTPFARLDKSVHVGIQAFQIEAVFGLVIRKVPSAVPRFIVESLQDLLFLAGSLYHLPRGYAFAGSPIKDSISYQVFRRLSLKPRKLLIC